MTRPRQQTDSDYRRIKLQPNGRCPLQNDDKTCHVHCQHGEQLLSNTCKTYPRLFTFQANRFEASLTLSCPEAARQILLNPSAMTFDQESRLPGDTQVRKINNLPKQFDLLRHTAFQALLGEKGTPDERLFRIGVLFSLVAAKQNNNQDISNTCAEFSRMCNDGRLSHTFSTIQPGTRGLAIILRKLLTETTFYRQNKVLLDYHHQLVTQLKDDYSDHQNIDMESLLRDHLPALNEFVNDCGHGLVNMMLHWVYSSDACRQTGDNLLNSYAQFCLKYVIIRFYAQMLAEEGKNSELLIGLVHSFSRSSDHNSRYLKDLHSSLRDENMGMHTQILSLLKQQ